VTAMQERRLRELRSRVLVRGFEYRQRRHARGVWFRLRRLLALSSEAYAVPRVEAERLLAEGWRPDPVGQELAPSRLVLVVPKARALQISSARPLDVCLSAELLAAESLVVVPFPD
jgi:hypothetical protein